MVCSDMSPWQESQLHLRRSSVEIYMEMPSERYSVLIVFTAWADTHESVSSEENKLLPWLVAALLIILRYD